MKVGPYQVLRKLGEGAYGKVYLARKGDASGFATWYALKRIARGHGRGPEFESYLAREARLGGLVNHPNLVRVHEVLSLKREWVLVQDYVDGVTLRAVLERRRTSGEPVPREAALELAAELLDTLHHLHTLRDPEGRESGFIHRDVKPGNVMLSEGHLKVMDFGVARGSEAGAGTLAGELRGTLAYMAPEQATGDPVGPASDQFAAGLSLLEMLSNGSPWGDVRGPAVLGRVVTGDVSAGLGRLEDDDPVMPIVMRMLGRDPASRFPTARDAARALRTLRAQTPTPPALRDFCSEEVAGLRGQGAEDVDHENPSWTGSWQWVSGGPEASVVLEPERDPEDVAAAAEAEEDDVEIPLVVEDESGVLDDDRVDLDGLAAAAEPAPAADVAPELAAEPDEPPEIAESPEPAPPAEPAAADAEGDEHDEIDLEFDLDPEPGGFGAAAAGLATFDENRTLPLESSPGARAALLRNLGLTGEAPAPTQGPRDSLADLQARLGDVDPEKTLPLGVGTLTEPPTPVPVAAQSARLGEPSQAGLITSPAPGPQPKAAQKPRKRRKRKASQAQRPAEVSVGAALWDQFIKSPLLGAGILLVLVVFIAATVRLAWVAIQPNPVTEDGELVDDMVVPGTSQLPPAPRVAPTPTPVAEAPENPDEAEELPGEATVDEPEPVPEAEVEAAAVAEAEIHVVNTAERPPEPRRADPVPEEPQGDDLDADMKAWRGDREVATPAPAAPQPGDIIGGANAGERLLERSDAERKVATRRDDPRREAPTVGEPTPESTPAESSAEAPPEEPVTVSSLRFLSSPEQSAGASLSIRVRSDGFYATSVSVYYQWRGEGSAGRKRRSLTRQGNGSFALDIPASEVRVDRLQLWFVAEPGGVTLGSASSPQEVRVR